MKKLTSWISRLTNPDILFACGKCPVSQVTFHSHPPYYTVGPTRTDFVFGFMYALLEPTEKTYRHVRVSEYNQKYHSRMIRLTHAHLNAIEEYAGFNDEVFYCTAVKEAEAHIRVSRELGMVPDEYYFTYVYPKGTHGDTMFRMFLSHLGEDNGYYQERPAT